MKTTFPREGDLTIGVVEGAIVVPGAIAALHELLRGGLTPLLLWDLTKAELAHLRLDNLRELAAAAKPVTDLRAGGRTAIVTGKTVDFGVGRMYQTVMDLCGQSVACRVFDDRGKALAWLRASEPAPQRDTAGVDG